MSAMDYDDLVVDLRQETACIRGPQAADAIVALRAEVAALRQDAARYRWLRSRFRVFGPHIDGQHGWCAMGDIGRLRGPNFDAAIDAALPAQKD